ncbi:hypothetical protein [Anaerosacchariphilus polymeriproducens]|uniref:Uncharacterized protein n=1 Tax=Anaerosacchariphilus polymeriproducens TaxID=1812858 RepID=A0A371AVB8_9FIRM|nr:hypothetical protein [Anaerosacchariphilus polymeriproducens]RDU23516.1 hypothetical protein DWV06_09165 [Anaerosacchariphilus polymeriproducens]
MEEIEAKDEVLQPFFMEIAPIRKLALINFEKNPEEIYVALEWQYLETKEEGNGFRLIAYRKDQYVDVYDEESLCIKEIGRFEVCNKGLKHYRKTAFQNPDFIVTEKGLFISLAFHDYKGRNIKVLVEERGKRPSRSLDLIAPVGESSKNPVIFPAFAMYQFDLVRKKDTKIQIEINGKKIPPDDFPIPFPKDGQMRYFTRYGCDCELIEFGRNQERILHNISCKNQFIYDENLIASYKTTDNQKKMEYLKFKHSKHVFILRFVDWFPDLLRMEDGCITGNFKMEMDESMGYISGEYQVKKKKSKVTITLIPCNGWTVKTKMPITKMMFKKRSVFCTWPKSYRYQQTIDLHTGKSVCHWERIKLK